VELTASASRYTGQPTAAQTFALWAVYDDGIGALVPAATVKSDILTAGQWNYVPLPTPLPLAIGACYNACTGGLARRIRSAT
jgi:hypothetical protein